MWTAIRILLALLPPELVLMGGAFLVLCGGWLFLSGWMTVRTARAARNEERGGN